MARSSLPRLMRRLPASEFHRASREESKTLNVKYSSKRYLPNSVGRVTAKTPTISESAFRKKREGVTKEKAIAERRQGVRAYASPAAHVRAQRAISRNKRRNPARAFAREKKAEGQHVTERRFERDNKWFLDTLGKKTGMRWRLVPSRTGTGDGKWVGEATGAEPKELTKEEFERLAAHWRANEKFYASMEGDVFRSPFQDSPKVGLRKSLAHHACVRFGECVG
jgi:hypothetical protein